MISSSLYILESSCFFLVTIQLLLMVSPYMKCSVSHENWTFLFSLHVSMWFEWHKDMSCLANRSLYINEEFYPPYLITSELLKYFVIVMDMGLCCHLCFEFNRRKYDWSRPRTILIRGKYMICTYPLNDLVLPRRLEMINFCFSFSPGQKPIQKWSNQGQKNLPFSVCAHPPFGLFSHLPIKSILSSSWERDSLMIRACSIYHLKCLVSTGRYHDLITWQLYYCSKKMLPVWTLFGLFGTWNWNQLG